MHAQELLVDKSEAGVDRLLADYKDEYCMKWVPVLNLKGKAGEEIWRNATEDGDAVIVRSGGAAAARGTKRKPSADEAAKQAASHGSHGAQFRCAHHVAVIPGPADRAAGPREPHT